MWYCYLWFLFYTFSLFLKNNKFICMDVGFQNKMKMYSCVTFVTLPIKTNVKPKHYKRFITKHYKHSAFLISLLIDYISDKKQNIFNNFCSSVPGHAYSSFHILPRYQIYSSELLLLSKMWAGHSVVNDISHVCRTEQNPVNEKM